MGTQGGALRDVPIAAGVHPWAPPPAGPTWEGHQRPMGETLAWGRGQFPSQGSPQRGLYKGASYPQRATWGKGWGSSPRGPDGEGSGGSRAQPRPWSLPKRGTEVPLPSSRHRQLRAAPRVPRTGTPSGTHPCGPVGALQPRARRAAARAKPPPRSPEPAPSPAGGADGPAPGPEPEGAVPVAHSSRVRTCPGGNDRARLDNHEWPARLIATVLAIIAHTQRLPA